LTSITSIDYIYIYDITNENDIAYELNINTCIKVNNSSSLSSSSSTATSTSSKSIQNKSKDQHQVLNIICDTYQMSFSEYMQQALVEAMRFDIEEGNLCDALLAKIGAEDSKKDNNSSPPSPTALTPDLMKNDLDLLKRLQTEIS
jgi:hypothetical protein